MATDVWQLALHDPGSSGRPFGHWPQSAVAGLLRNVRADLVRREPGALRYEIILGPAEERGYESSAAKGGVACGRAGTEEVGE